MSSIMVIIFEVIPDQPTQMLFIHYNNMIQTFPSQGANQSFHIRILPRRPRSDELVFHTQTRDPALKFLTENSITISQ